MPTKDIDVVKGVFEAANEGDFERMKELTHPDCKLKEAESLPYGGTTEGKDAFVKLMGKVDDAFEDFSFDEQYMEETENHVLVYFIFGAKSEDGEWVEMPLIEIQKVEDEMVIESEIFYKDTAKLLRETE